MTPARVQRKRLLAGTFLLAYLLTLAAIVSPARAHHLNPDRHPWSIRLVHKTDHAVRSARHCQSYLDRDRSPQRSTRSYVRETVAYRQWAYGLWRGREWQCGVKVRRLNAHPPSAIRYVFGRLGDWNLRVALDVASDEAGSGDIDSHPFCTRTDNGVGFWGCFQFGSWARSVFGFAWSALGQAWAAFKYVVSSGGWCSGWSATADHC